MISTFLSIQAQDFIEDGHQVCIVAYGEFLSIQAQDFIEEMSGSKRFATVLHS